MACLMEPSVPEDPTVQRSKKLDNGSVEKVTCGRYVDTANDTANES